MRKQSSIRKQQKQRYENEAAKRLQAAQMLRHGSTISAAQYSCGVSFGTTQRISKAIRTADDHLLAKLLNPAANKPGRRAVIDETESQMIIERVIEVAKKGFPITLNIMKSLHARIANDGRDGYKHDVPTNDTSRAFRARHRALTYRNTENKDSAKLSAENYEHVQTLEKALREVENNSPGILSDPDLIWNMDETNVDGEYGQREKAFVGSHDHHGAFRSSTKKPSKHITAVIAISASGRIAPPFLLLLEKVLCLTVFCLSMVTCSETVTVRLFG